MRVDFFIFAVAALALMSIQGLLTIFQVKSYRKAVSELKGKGLLGFGTRKSYRGGQVLIISYERKLGIINACKCLKGISVFEKFKNEDKYIGLTLEQARALGIEEDGKLNKRLRIKKPYDPNVLDRKKGALIQAIEAIDLRLAREEQEALEKQIENTKDDNMAVI